MFDLGAAAMLQFLLGICVILMPVRGLAAMAGDCPTTTQPYYEHSRYA
jgi:hypothetical protein